MSIMIFKPFNVCSLLLDSMLFCLKKIATGRLEKGSQMYKGIEKKLYMSVRTN